MVKQIEKTREKYEECMVAAIKAHEEMNELKVLMVCSWEEGLSSLPFTRETHQKIVHQHGVAKLLLTQVIDTCNTVINE